MTPGVPVEISPQLWYALVLALVTALGAAIAAIGLLVKAVLDRRSQRNGHGHVTRLEFDAAVVMVKGHLDEKSEHLDEKIEKLDKRMADLHARRGEFASALDVERLYRRVDQLERDVRLRA